MVPGGTIWDSHKKAAPSHSQFSTPFSNFCLRSRKQKMGRQNGEVEKGTMGNPKASQLMGNYLNLQGNFEPVPKQNHHAS
jgi:hypothetical protein